MKYFVRFGKQGNEANWGLIEFESKELATWFQKTLNKAKVGSDFGTETDGFIEYSVSKTQLLNRKVWKGKT